MPDSLNVTTPSQTIKTAVDLFGFTVFLSHSFENELITPSSFQENIRMDEGGHGLDLKATFQQDSLKVDGRNIVIVALGTSAMVTNKAVEVVFGQPDPNDTSAEGSARAILYQIRCAFAHDPLNPVWTPKPHRYKHLYRVTFTVPRAAGGKREISISVHPPSLKGKPLIFEHIGNLTGYYLLLQYFRERVAADPKGQIPYLPCYAEP